MAVVTSSSAGARLAAGRAFAARFPPDTELLIVAPTRGAADDFARDAARRRSRFGLHRFSLVELAAGAATADRTATGRMAGTEINLEALAARVAFDAAEDNGLAYFGPVASTPGFPKALARTIHELRLAAATSGVLASAGAGAADVGRLLDAFDRGLNTAGVNDRAALFITAAAVWQRGIRWFGYPTLMLDVPLNSVAERRFAAAVLAGARESLVTCPAGDESTLTALEGLGLEVVDVEDDASTDTDLGRLRRRVFMLDPPPSASASGDVRLFSAPGEAREALEIARRALDEAAAGVPFDEMAVCLRAPQQYLSLLEHAFARAGVPAHFDRGTRRPDPAGRAFIALLSCACEKLSARRFDEYLSLGQVPRIGERGLAGLPAVPDDEAYARFGTPSEDEAPADVVAPDPVVDSDDEAIIAGTLRAPWKWEELIVESAVIGGVDRVDGQRRWRRRLDGLTAEYKLRLAELRSEEADSPRVARLERDLRNLGHLRAFALPVIDVLAGWPERATWGEWLDAFAALAPRVLQRPTRVLQILAGLRPMASVGPVSLEEARDVLQDRLLALEREAPRQRYGCVFVGTPHQLRGRAFRVVFVPGLAERAFPQRVREDPLLLDDVRRETGAALVTRADRTMAERLLLRLAIGAATERLYLSYPRLGSEMGDVRPRVPSFYALDVVRAITGRIRDYRTLAADAAAEGGASLAWPAPRDPLRAVDDFEHDLAVLKPLLEADDASALKGQAHYLLELNESLRRSVISRWARGRPRWSSSDGVIQVTPRIASALERNRLKNRPYSLSALQRFAACPYQFLLAAIHRIEPWEEPEPIVRMDPLTRGSLFHRIQAEFFRALQAAAMLPVTTGSVDRAMATLDQVVTRVAHDYAEQLAPAIDRVWRDEVDEIRRDLRIWVQRMASQPEWIPEYFEFSFGLSDEGRDPRSLPDPVEIDSRFVLRGSVDLVERHRDRGTLRVTDHKTGRNRSKPEWVIGGGAVLQPVLYSLVVERGLGQSVETGRLYYCTTPGGFGELPIPINAATRAQGLDALTIVDRAVELGHLPADPQKDACRWCDFRAVCGPDEERRVRGKPDALRADLLALRSMR